jgi:very-short-patch-repair endonuclease
VSPQKPPHPDAARPPSPARGEGSQGEPPAPTNKMLAVGARSRNRSKAAHGTVKPSPLRGEGGASAPGEGEAANSKSANPKTKRARTLRKAMTDAERKLWRLLRNRNLSGHKFRRQVPIGPYVADFLCFEARLIVEADGGQHATAGLDAKRDEWLCAEGYRVLRFWNSDISDNPEGVLQRLAATLPIHQEAMQ